MTDPTKRKKDKTELPCEWVEQEGFEISTGRAKGQNAEPKLSDTAFLLKAKKNPSNASPRLPGS